ncbi:ring-hydroxylating dioxygenase ferredoxin reductase family protein [Rhizobium lemnae]|uniref:Benzoate 1,2-dioxygenase electron transfer component BenC n=1 Tax=Rhizobium lemnae TaxID=1214924 RepID=A0ABV8ED67_9HYPH|nr:benzoate 1,2-dioxygenase electron transfer component BenC [Rhizobium lemnae]MCJ8509406.1 ring-hydroxylating dioxygenase ferredoxin reductase family protein [Rhizobium lemnae]
MSSYRIALNFEDGVTRFVDCRAGEKLLDAAYRSQINLPMDCSDGVCGTCKCRSETGTYDLGDDYIEDALSPDEAAARLVLTCQMRPTSDGVVSVPTRSSVCKTAQQKLVTTVTRVTPHGDAAVVLELQVEDNGRPQFLPGQYINLDVPGTGASRSYSFTNAPGGNHLGFLIRKLPSGLMSNWLTHAKPGDRVTATGPLGSVYLRDTDRPLLFLAGGTGLAPFLSMLEVLADNPSRQPVHLVYGVTRDEDLVLVDVLESYADHLPQFTFTTVVADKGSRHPRTGWVTDHMPAGLPSGETDVYLCGPPPMVDAVRSWLNDRAITPNSFHYEKFTPNLALKESA